MPNKKKKFPKGKPLPLAAFFTGSHSDEGYDSDNEREENQAWAAERERQKAASHKAEALGQRKAQNAVLLGEENDFRNHLITTEKATRAHLQEKISEALIEREWIEFKIARREAEEQEKQAKKAPFIQLSTQQMLHRANIADKETESRISLFNSAATSMKKAQEAEKARLTKEKLEADRKKAAERAKAFEEQKNKKAKTDKTSLFQLVDDPTASAAAEPKAPDTTQTGGWLSGWFSKN